MNYLFADRTSKIFALDLITHCSVSLTCNYSRLTQLNSPSISLSLLNSPPISLSLLCLPTFYPLPQSLIFITARRYLHFCKEISPLLQGDSRQGLLNLASFSLLSLLDILRRDPSSPQPFFATTLISRDPSLPRPFFAATFPRRDLSSSTIQKQQPVSTSS